MCNARFQFSSPSFEFIPRSRQSLTHALERFPQGAHLDVALGGDLYRADKIPAGNALCRSLQIGKWGNDGPLDQDITRPNQTHSTDKEQNLDQSQSIQLGLCRSFIQSHRLIHFLQHNGRERLKVKDSLVKGHALRFGNLHHIN